MERSPTLNTDNEDPETKLGQTVITRIDALPENVVPICVEPAKDGAEASAFPSSDEQRRILQDEASGPVRRDEDKSPSKQGGTWIFFTKLPSC